MNNVTETAPQLWVCGARGSFATTGAQYAGFGNNTSCFALRFGSCGILIDCGTGLGAAEAALFGCARIDVFFTHFHYDHVLGLLCAPWLMREPDKVHLWGWAPDSSIKEALSDLASPPYWPVPLPLDRCGLHDVRPDESLMPTDGVTVRTMAANHPNGGLLYRIAAQGKSVVFAFDHEHGVMDDALIRFADHCDVMVYDGMFDAAEYANYEGWGHSSYTQGLRFAKAAGAGKLIVTHHAPWHTDTDLLRMEREAQRRSPDCSFAREGACCRL